MAFQTARGFNGNRFIKRSLVSSGFWGGDGWAGGGSGGMLGGSVCVCVWGG